MKTVKVRVAVAVGEDGSWNSRGWSGDTDSEAEGIAGESIETLAKTIHFLTAELSIPEPRDIPATVEQGGEW